MGKKREAGGYTNQREETRTTAIRVLLCDDHEIPRAAIAGMLALERDIEVVGEAANGAQAVELARALRPDVTVMDLKMPVMDGFDAMTRIRDGDPGARVLVLTGAGTDADLVGAVEEGAAGYVDKTAPKDELARAIRIVAGGEPYVSHGVGSVLFRLQQDPARAMLTEREAEILRMVASGKKTQEIARSVHLAERTVKHYLELICEKLGAKNRSHAVALAVQRGLIRVDEG
jgi:DNA-binding NarL/FixJ family response regulator